MSIIKRTLKYNANRRRKRVGCPWQVEGLRGRLANLQESVARQQQLAAEELSGGLLALERSQSEEVARRATQSEEVVRQLAAAGASKAELAEQQAALREELRSVEVST